MASLLEFAANPVLTHQAFQQSILAPVAPEYTTGEVVLAAAYRRLVLGIRDNDVDLRKVGDLPHRVSASVGVQLHGPAAEGAFGRAWDALIKAPGGLGSPPPLRQSRQLRQLMPLVPEMARHAGVLGLQPRNRWEPGTLLLAALASGAPPQQSRALIQDFAVSLGVGPSDDLLAVFVQNCLVPLAEATPGVNAPNTEPIAPAWRQGLSGATPAERFAQDLSALLGLKALLTRREWTVLVEAQLRLGLGLHQLWLCRLTWRLWDQVRRVAAGASPPYTVDLEDACWVPVADDPLLELGRDSAVLMRRGISRYAAGRIGINLVLYALDESGHPWPGKLGVGGDKSPASELSSFLKHLSENGAQLRDVIRQNFGVDDAGAAAGELSDEHPELASIGASATNNMFEFLKYSLGQLTASSPESRTYDQSYLIFRNDRPGKRNWPVKPGPATLMLLVHAACAANHGLPTSLDDFRNHLAEYGIEAGSGQLVSGVTRTSLEQLGLLIDSPDAGGGRLLLDPFA